MCSLHSCQLTGSFGQTEVGCDPVHPDVFILQQTIYELGCSREYFFCWQGTQLYDAKRGSFVDLGILDVMQIFGRAGRPQFDTFGHGTIITTHDKLSHYLSLMTRQNPIESQFINSLTDNLNAEVMIGCNWEVERGFWWEEPGLYDLAENHSQSVH